MENLVVSNRELAALVYTVILITDIILYHSTRRALVAVIKIAFSVKIILMVSLTMGYIALGVYVLNRCELWAFRYLKETVLWAVFSGLTIGISGVTERKPNQFYIGVMKSQVRIAVVIGFIVNLYSLPLLGELVLLPALTSVGIMGVLSEKDENLYKAKGCLETIQAMVGIGLLVYVGYQIYHQPDKFFNASVIRSFSIPILLAVWTIPAGYALSIISAYESAFIRMNLDGNLRRYAKLKFAFMCGLNANRIKRADTLLCGWLFSAENREDIDSLFSELALTLNDPVMDEPGDFVWEDKELSFGNTAKFVDLNEYLEIVLPWLSKQ